MSTSKGKNMILNNWGVIPLDSMSKLKFNRLKILTVLLLMGTAGVFISYPGLCGSPVGEEIISLDLSEQPLGEVLDDIAATTGYHFIFDEKWDTFLVSASIKNEPLYRGLKRILRNLNNVIIYSSDRTIKIIIFDEVETSDDRSDALVNTTSDDESVQRSYALPAETLPQPLSDDQGRSDIEEDSRLSEESDATDTVSDETAPGDGEPTETETAEPTAESTGSDGSEQKEEDTPAPDENSPEESTTDN
jgi:hypothetical protein